MPIINIKMTHEDGGATRKQKEELARGITELFAKVFNGRGAKSAVVLIDEVSTDNYAIGGETISNIRKKAKQNNKKVYDEEI